MSDKLDEYGMNSPANIPIIEGNTTTNSYTTQNKQTK